MFILDCDICFDIRSQSLFALKYRLDTINVRNGLECSLLRAFLLRERSPISRIVRFDCSMIRSTIKELIYLK